MKFFLANPENDQQFYIVLCRHVIKSFIQGFLPGIALKIFLILLPTILMFMSKFEGYISLSSLERKSAGKYYIFLFVNVFLCSIITGTALQQLDVFIHQSPNQYVFPPFPVCLVIKVSKEIVNLFVSFVQLCILFILRSILSIFWDIVHQFLFHILEYFVLVFNYLYVHICMNKTLINV